jgi:hypothetical protein
LQDHRELLVLWEPLVLVPLVPLEQQVLRVPLDHRAVPLVPQV